MINIAEWNSLESEYNTPKNYEVYCDKCGGETVDLCICSTGVGEGE